MGLARLISRIELTDFPAGVFGPGHCAVLISSANTLGRPARCQRITVSGPDDLQSGQHAQVPARYKPGKYQTVDAAEG